MGWKVAGDGGAYVTWASSGWSADPRTEADLTAALTARQSVMATPTGPAYTPTGRADEFGVYLLATCVVPGARLANGTPPTKDLPGARLPNGAVG